MPNELNFGSPIVSMNAERKTRITPEEDGLVTIGVKSILFGTHPKDNIELWFYYPDGSYYSNLRLSPEDIGISLSTIVDSNGAQEVLNLDLDVISTQANLVPGRYSVAIYLLRDEVGSLNGERLIITDISTSRTEVKIAPPVPSATLFKEVYEFVVPSVPRMYAKALLDEIFAKSLDFKADWTESLNALDITRIVNTKIGGTTDRIVRSRAESSYMALLREIKNRTYTLALELLVERTKDDWNVQRAELRVIIVDAMRAVIAQMKDAKEIDPRFRLV